MLKNSFQHIPGIGTTTERQIWDSGLLGWEYLTPDNSFQISPKRFENIKAFTGESFEHLHNNNPNYFAELLPSKEHWRFFPEFRDSTAYIDILEFSKNIFPLMSKPYNASYCNGTVIA